MKTEENQLRFTTTTFQKYSRSNMEKALSSQSICSNQTAIPSTMATLRIAV